MSQIKRNRIVKSITISQEHATWMKDHPEIGLSTLVGVMLNKWIAEHK